MASAAATPPSAADPPRPRGRRRPSLRARILLVALGVLLPLLLAEGALRLFGALLPGDYQTRSFVETHPEFGRRNQPGAGWKKTKEFTSWIEVNSKHLRGPEVEYAKPPGERRVLVLGDSFTFAEQVNQHETFVHLLEAALNARGDGATYRVLNGGSNGWATANQLVFLAKEGLRYEPDLVVLAFYVGNDVSDNYRRLDVKRVAEEADLALRGADAFEGPRRVLRRSMLYTVFESGVLAKLPWYASAAGDATDASYRPAPKTEPEAREAWAITESLIDRMRDVAESRGARFMVMAIPVATTVTHEARVIEAGGDPDAVELNDEPLPGFEDPHGTLAGIVGRHGVEALDLLPSLSAEAARSDRRLYYAGNAHWTAAGHAVAAGELERFVVGRGLLR
jgi:hypothetical protein